MGQGSLGKSRRQNRYQLVPAFGFDGLIKPIDSDQLGGTAYRLLKQVGGKVGFKVEMTAKFVAGCVAERLQPRMVNGGGQLPARNAQRHQPSRITVITGRVASRDEPVASQPVHQLERQRRLALASGLLTWWLGYGVSQGC